MPQDRTVKQALQPISFACNRCGREVVPGEAEFFVVRIEAFADPTPPEITEADLRRDHRRELEALLDRLRGLSERQALEQVYRRCNLVLCNRCCDEWFSQLPAER